MKIRFLGYKVKNKTGCPVCGGRKKSSGESIRRRQTINIPGCRSIEFVVGNEYEVTAKEWDYLSNMPEFFQKVI